MRPGFTQFDFTSTFCIGITVAIDPKVSGTDTGTAVMSTIMRTLRNLRKIGLKVGQLYVFAPP